MARRKVIAQRETLPDPKYHDVVVAKFINIVMKKGKKSIAERVVYGALGRIQEQEKDVEKVLEKFKLALSNVKPRVEVKSRRVGGATYQVPTEVRPARQMTLAMRWIIDAARKRRARSMGDKLANELLDAIESKGAAVKRREDMTRMSEANKAFSHYRW